MNTQTPGKLTKETDGYKVIYERHLPYNISTVWDAITNPAKMAIWFTDVEMDFKEGGKMVIRFRDEEHSESYGKIVKIDPNRVFEWLWLNTDGPDELATWEVFEEGADNTRLVLTYSRVGEDLAISVAAGWHSVLNDLERVMNGETISTAFGAGPTEEGTRLKKVYEEKYSHLVKKQ